MIFFILNMHRSLSQLFNIRDAHLQMEFELIADRLLLKNNLN